MILADEHKISFWQYFKPEVSLARWKSIPFKYIQNETMVRVLLDICHHTTGTVQEVEAIDIYHYFCKLNRITEKQIIHN